MALISIEQAIFRETDQVFHLNSFKDDAQAVSLLIQAAQHKVCIYSQRLNPPIFDTQIVLQACERFCLKNDRAQLHVLVEKPKAVTQRSHRLLHLSHRYSSSLFLKTLHPRLTKRYDEFVCIDKSAYFYLPNNEHFEASCHFADAQRTGELLETFEDAWEQSESDVEFRDLLL